MALGIPSEDIVLKIKAEKTDVDKSVKSIQQELREAKKEAILLSRQFGELSPEAEKGAQKVANLRGEVRDLNKAVAGLNPHKFEQFATLTGGLVSGFEAARGAAVLFGNDTENLEKTLVKLQATMAFAQGIQGVLEARKQFTALALQISGAVTKAFQNFSKAAKSALISTGIGALIVALGVVVAYWDDIIEAVTGVNKEEKKNLEILELQTKETQKTLDAHKGRHEQMKLEGKTEKEILTTEIKITDELISQLKLQIAQQEQLNKTAEDNSKIKKWWNPYGIFTDSPDVVKKKGQDIIETQNETLNKLLEDRAAAQLKIIAIDKTESEKQVADNKKSIADKKKYNDDIHDLALKEIKDQDDLNQTKWDALQKQNKREYDLRAKDNDSKEKTSQEEKKKTEETLSFLKKSKEDYNKWVSDNHKKETEEEKQYRQKLNDLATTSSISLINSLQELNTALSGKTEAQQKAAFKRNKALAIAETIISTYSSAQKAYESQFSPPTVASPYLGAAAATVAIATGLAKLATISKTTFQGSGGGGGSASGSGGGSNGSPRAASTGFSNIRPANSGSGNINLKPKELPPQKVYVVSKEMKEQISKDDMIQARAIIK